MDVTTRIDRLEDALAHLAAAQMRTEAAFGHLTEAQARTEARVTELAEAQARTEATLGRLAEAQARLVEAQARTEAQVGTLVAWQKGEAGRRKGEQLELHVHRRAPSLFQGGDGGTTAQRSVQRQLTALLAPSLGEDQRPEPEADPFLADLLWWKGEQLAVIEVSSVIDEDDVNRAFRRAETLRRAGVLAIGILYGEAWNDLETREWARMHRLAWKVADDVSDGFVDFRRRPW